MEYREIVAVTGLSGLYQLLTTKSDGAIVRSIADKTTKFISARQHNVTPLDSIEVYTTGDNVRLHEVFLKMKELESTTPLADAKSDNATIKKYFMTVFPGMDEDRVYVSDMKKMLKWFEVLKANDLLNFEAPAQEEAPAAEAKAEKAADAPADEATEEKPAKKARAKKAEAEDGVEGEEKPKKTAKKKKADTEEGAEEKPKATAKKKKTEE